MVVFDEPQRGHLAHGAIESLIGVNTVYSVGAIGILTLFQVSLRTSSRVTEVPDLVLVFTPQPSHAALFRVLTTQA
jgi:hypothetical protein